MWSFESVFYQIYPWAFAGAPRKRRRLAPPHHQGGGMGGLPGGARGRRRAPQPGVRFVDAWVRHARPHPRRLPSRHQRGSCGRGARSARARHSRGARCGVNHVRPRVLGVSRRARAPVGLGVPRLVLPQLRRGLRLWRRVLVRGLGGLLRSRQAESPAIPPSWRTCSTRCAGGGGSLASIGLRLDVAYSLDRDFLRSLHGVARELSATAPAAAPLGGPRAEDTAFVLIGETLHGELQPARQPEMLDSCTNYECYKGLYSSFNSQNMFEIAHSLHRQFGGDPWCIYRGAPSALICRQPRCDPFGEYPHRPCLRAARLRGALRHAGDTLPLLRKRVGRDGRQGCT